MEQDPTGVYFDLSLKRDLEKQKLYDSNLQVSQSHLQLMDDTLGKVYDLLLQAKADLIQADSTGGPDPEAVKAELDRIKLEILFYARTKIGNYYIFSGNLPTQDPYANTASQDYTQKYQYTGGTSDYNLVVGSSEKVPTFLSGGPIFSEKLNPEDDTSYGREQYQTVDEILYAIETTDYRTKSVFAALDVAERAVELQDSNAINAALKNLEYWINHINVKHVSIGTIEQKVQNYQMLNGNTQTNLSNQISRIEDTPYDQYIAQYQNMKTTYQVLLSVLGKEESQTPALLKYF
jgi:flagellin-like hook-associated protein FlgL